MLNVSDLDEKLCGWPDELMPWVSGGEAGEGQFEAKGRENLVEEDNQDCYIIQQLILSRICFCRSRNEILYERKSNTFEIILEAQHQINCATNEHHIRIIQILFVKGSFNVKYGG